MISHVKRITFKHVDDPGKGGMKTAPRKTR